MFYLHEQVCDTLLATCSAGNFNYESELWRVSGYYILSLEEEHNGRQADLCSIFHVWLLNHRSVNKACTPRKPEDHFPGWKLLIFCCSMAKG